MTFITIDDASKYPDRETMQQIAARYVNDRVKVRFLPTGEIVTMSVADWDYKLTMSQGKLSWKKGLVAIKKRFVGSDSLGLFKGVDIVPFFDPTEKEYPYVHPRH